MLWNLTCLLSVLHVVHVCDCDVDATARAVKRERTLVNPGDHRPRPGRARWACALKPSPWQQSSALHPVTEESKQQFRFGHTFLQVNAVEVAAHKTLRFPTGIIVNVQKGCATNVSGIHISPHGFEQDYIRDEYTRFTA